MVTVEGEIEGKRNSVFLKPGGVSSTLLSARSGGGDQESESQILTGPMMDSASASALHVHLVRSSWQIGCCTQ